MAISILDDNTVKISQTSNAIHTNNSVLSTYIPTLILQGGTTSAPITWGTAEEDFKAVETKVICICCKKFHSTALMQEIRIGSFRLNTNICSSCLEDLIEKIKCELGLEEEENKKDNINV